MGETEVSQDKTLDSFSAVMLVANAAIGAGILNFPEAFRYAGGPVFAMVIQLIVILFVTIGLCLTSLIVVKLNVKSMQEYMLVTYGKYMEIFASTTIIMYSFMSCVAYHVVLGDQIDRVLYNLISPNFCHTWYYNRKFTIIVASLMFKFPFLFPKKIAVLKYISSIGIFAILYVILLIVVKYFVGDFEKGEILWVPKDVLKVTMTVPPFCFAYHSHIQAVPIFWSMKNQSVTGQLNVCLLAMILCFLLYSLTGTFGYLTFGSLVRSNILLNYPANEPFIIIAIVLVAIKICAVYPVVVFSGRDAVIDMYIEATAADKEKNHFIRRIIVATGWFLFAVILGVFFPNISVVIGFLGFLTSFFMFIFPAAGILKTDFGDHLLGKFVAIVMILLGAIVAVNALTVAIWQLMKGQEAHETLCK